MLNLAKHGGRSCSTEYDHRDRVLKCKPGAYWSGINWVSAQPFPTAAAVAWKTMQMHCC